MDPIGFTSETNWGASLRAAYAQSLVYNHLLQKYRVAKDPNATALPGGEHSISTVPLEPADRPRATTKRPPPSKDDTICIIGAGAAGLATAMSLHNAKYHNITILEASNVAGGRLFTYNFPDRGDGCKNNFCDIGAMRIPNIPRMKVTRDLIAKLGVPTKEYYYKLKDKERDEEVPKMWWFQKGHPHSKKYETTMNNLLLQFGFLVEDKVTKKKSTGNFDKAYAKFMEEKFDLFSTRSYLLSEGYTYEETLHAELFASGRNGSFDQALLESFCDWLDFQVAENVKWDRIDGGMQVLVKAMVEKVLEQKKTTIKYNSPVIALKNNEDRKTISVTTRDGKTVEYNTVFNTTTMSCLERMDISELGLPDKVLTGIRSLHYDNSAKVAIKFRKAWWMDFLRSPGGVSATDLPISNIVYPSFDIAEGEPAVLLASYSWSQDAARMAALFNNHRGGNEPNVDDVVVTQVLKNLAQVWSKSGMEKPPTYEQLRELYVDHYAFSWDHDPYTGGAFALFGPGQFKEFYAAFQDMHCQGKFMICGEAVSTEHAWISGALNSAYKAVLTWTDGGEGQIELKRSYLGGGKNANPLELSEKLLFWTVQLNDVVLSAAGEVKEVAVAA